MRNLKRALSLVLAAAMLIGMMVVAASAVGVNDFTDKDEIVNKTAVDTLIALNVVNGKEDGSYYDPTGIVTRAEMAKMITVILNGGKTPTLGVKDTPSFTDIKGTWAEEYIEYCASSSVGAISGRGNGTFDPTGTVTGSEAAKMLLVTLGYGAQVYGLTGPNWEINTNVLANSVKLYEDLDIQASAGLTRDNAAQMIFNALNSSMVVLRYSQDITTGNITQSYEPTNKSLLETKYGTTERVGILESFSYDSEKGKYTYNLADDSIATTPDSFTTSIDATDLFRMNVKVIYKTVNGKTTVFGIFAEGSSVIVETVVNNLDLAALTTTADKLKVDGVEYKVDMNTAGTANVIAGAYAFNSTTCETFATVGAKADFRSFRVCFLDTNNNGKIDTVTYLPVAVETVNYVGVKSYTLSATGNKEFTDKTISVYDGIAKDDKVMVVAAANTAKGVTEVTKLDKLSGKVTSVKGDDVQIDGTWYNAAGKGMTLGTEYDFVAINGVIVDTPTATTSSTKVEDYVVLVNKQALGGFQLYNQAQILRSSGEFEVVDLEADADNGSGVDFSSLTLATLYTISDADGDGKYVLTAIATSAGGDGKVGGFDGYTTGAYAKADGKAGTIDGKAIASDAVVFVKTSTGYKVVTGADLAKVSVATTKNAYYNTSSSTGFATISLAFVESEMGSASDLQYGYVVADVEKVLNDKSVTVAKVTFWNGKENVTLNTAADTDALAKGAYFSYKVDANNNMTNITAYALNVSGQAVTAWDGTYMQFSGIADTFKVDENTVIIYVDSTAKTGAEGGSIVLANTAADSSKIKNVVAVAAADKTLDFVFVDVNNEVK